MTSRTKLSFVAVIVLVAAIGCGTTDDASEETIACDALNEQQCESAAGRCTALYGYPYDFDRGCFAKAEATYLECRELCGNNAIEYAVIAGEKTCFLLSTACGVSAPLDLVGGESCGDQPNAGFCDAQ